MSSSTNCELNSGKKKKGYTSVLISASFFLNNGLNRTMVGENEIITNYWNDIV